MSANSNRPRRKGGQINYETMKDTKIEWCDHTFNPWIGCTKVSTGCKNCYAENLNSRWKHGNWGKGAPRRRTSEQNWKQPLKWNRQAEEEGVRKRVFCASMADWLDDEVDIEWLADLLKLIYHAPNLDWLLLTKRPQNFYVRIRDALFCVEGLKGATQNEIEIACEQDPTTEAGDWLNRWFDDDHPSNVWIGTSVEDQASAELRIPQLLEIPAKVRFLSCEPLLEEVLLDQSRCEIHDRDEVEECSIYGEICNECAADGGSGEMPCGWWLGDVDNGIHWVIVGGESGSNARPFDPKWAERIKDDCESQGVAFFMKQMGGKRKPFPEIPENLMVREFPNQ